jgi:hypothetical protein
VAWCGGCGGSEGLGCEVVSARERGLGLGEIEGVFRSAMDVGERDGKMETRL